MLLSRTTILLILCFSFNTTLADDDTTHSSNGYVANPQESYSEQLRPRKRGQNSQTQLLPSAWSVNANNGGVLCYIDPEQVLLWRDNATFASRLSIKSKGSNKPLNLRWAKKQDTLKWPHNRVKLIPNNTYYVKLNQHEAAFQVIITKQLPEALWHADTNEQAAWMRENACILQANYLQQMTTQ
ncbi:hypothetical protein [Candidatus Albibeggiatoa sp. nov. NOAA]|uniref:hypothetical protein n=1 Tax=Candidatus Albibeggiatoa sp. nov. NOAA TaxID=3162724 RepID=UPI0032FFDD55|nr:hypothetical protein [Thiotrichaceae bacterium]